MLKYKKKVIKILELNLENKQEWEKIKNRILEICDNYYLFPNFIDMPAYHVKEHKEF